MLDNTYQLLVFHVKILWNTLFLGRND
jgi:hypothetical protein